MAHKALAFLKLLRKELGEMAQDIWASKTGRVWSCICITAYAAVPWFALHRHELTAGFLLDVGLGGLFFSLRAGFTTMAVRHRQLIHELATTARVTITQVFPAPPQNRRPN